MSEQIKMKQIRLLLTNQLNTQNSKHKTNENDKLIKCEGKRDALDEFIMSISNSKLK